jgi:hypothetical protein
VGSPLDYRARLVVLDSLCYLCKILMLSQFELNKVTPFTAYSYYNVKLLLDKDFPNMFILEWLRIFTEDLSRATVRPVVEHNNASL